MRSLGVKKLYYLIENVVARVENGTPSIQSRAREPNRRAQRSSGDGAASERNDGAQAHEAQRAEMVEDIAGLGLPTGSKFVLGGWDRWSV